MSRSVSRPVVRNQCLAPGRAGGAPIYGGRYRRMFESLAPHEADRADAYRSLAARDLQRGHATGLPSGEAVARELGVEPLSAAECGLAEHGWDGETPLWFYILREAGVRHDGDRLGEVGGLIVGEVLVGIVDADPESFRAAEPDSRPRLPSAEPGRYRPIDLLRAPELTAA